MASNAEIARDIVIACTGTSAATGDWVAEQYKIILKAVGEAVEAEEERERAAGKRRYNEG